MTIKKVVCVFCEGNHDITFAGLLFKDRGWQPYKEPLKVYPAPFPIRFKKAFEDHDIAEYMPSDVRKPFMPELVLRKKEALLMFFNIMGKNNVTEPIGLIKALRNSQPQDNNEPSFSQEPMETAFCFILDADRNLSKGNVEATLTEFKKNYGETFPKINALKAGKIFTESTERLGCYILPDNAQDGTLEDLVEKVLKDQYEEYYQETRSYLTARQSFSAPDKEKKAALTAIGQHKKPGRSLAVVLKEAELIDKNKLKEHTACSGLATLLECLAFQ